MKYNKEFEDYCNKNNIEDNFRDSAWKMWKEAQKIERERIKGYHPDDLPFLIEPEQKNLKHGGSYFMGAPIYWAGNEDYIAAEDFDRLLRYYFNVCREIVKENEKRLEKRLTKQLK
jgi:hypothetical protein